MRMPEIYVVMELDKRDHSIKPAFWFFNKQEAKGWVEDNYGERYIKYSIVPVSPWDADE